MKKQDLLAPGFDINDIDPIECKECSGQFFRQVMMLKVVPKLVVGAQKDVVVPMPAFRCDDCGAIIEEMTATGGQVHVEKGN
jgi:DNA-directed RNA polymerase subunit RPC12/RpoP